MFHVLCSNSVVVPGQVELQVGNRVTVKFLHNKQEQTETYELSEVFDFDSSRVTLFVPCGARAPCLLALPSPFNNTLKRGNTLLFYFEGSRLDQQRDSDFVSLWNLLCNKSLTWQHSRPKKSTDALQKLGMPAKLSEYLRDQVIASGNEVPLMLDEDEEDLVAEDETESSLSSTAESDSYQEEEEYSTGALDEEEEEDVEEEEEEEEDAEPEEIEEPDED
jgi:hypothetical protein